MSISTATKFDIGVINGGSVQVLQGLTDAGREWLDDNCPCAQRYGANGIAVEIGYVRDVLSGALGDGMMITKDEMELYEDDNGEFYLRRVE